MASKTRTTYPGKPGVWPGGEPKSVRDAYDSQFAKEQQDRKAAKKGGGK